MPDTSYPELGCYFPTYKSLALILKGDLCLLMGFLLNLNKLKSETNKDGWFTCSCKYYAESLRVYSERVQRRNLEFLRHMGYIETEYETSKHRRWIRINLDAIANDVKMALIEHQNTMLKWAEHRTNLSSAHGNNQHEQRTNLSGAFRGGQRTKMSDGQRTKMSDEQRTKMSDPRNKKQKETLSADADGACLDSFTGETMPLFQNGESAKEVDVECAKMLYEALFKKGLVDSKSKVRQWAKEFASRKIRCQNMKWKKAFHWYLKNINKRHVPVAFCAKTFFDKLPQIISAMNRQERDSDDARDKRQQQDVW